MIIYIVLSDGQIIGAYTDKEFAKDIANEWNADCYSVKLEGVNND
jgi:hypothetical protein